MAKVLLINGSPRANGCTATALKEMMEVFLREGIETELLQIGKQDIRGCVSCGSCWKKGKCNLPQGHYGCCGRPPCFYTDDCL